MSFLVDSDTCSAYLKGDRRVWGRFMQYSGVLHVSVVTVGELFTWARRAKAPPQRLIGLQALLGVATVLPVDLAVATKFGHCCWTPTPPHRTWTFSTLPRPSSTT